MNVLIVEDDYKLAEAVAHILSAEKILNDVVHDGQTGIDYAENASYDVMILDNMLPVKNGFQVTQELRRRGNSLPILMLTARNTLADKVEGLNSGADDYMTKPFAPEELLARVHALARRQGPVQIKELNYRDLHLNLENCELTCGTESIHLSYKEFELLKLLMGNPQMTFSKEKMILDIWGMDSNATENNVEAYISFLRKKMKFINSSVTIRNIPKIGYCLEV